MDELVHFKQALPAYQRSAAKEERGVKKLLERYLPEWKLHSGRILSICAGLANDEDALLQHCGKGTELISIDHNPGLEERARILGRKTLIQGDVRRLDDCATGKFDIIVGRNVPLNPDAGALGQRPADYWPRVFYDLRGRLRSKGALLLTLLRKDEFERARAILSTCEYRVQIAEDNPCPVPSDYYCVRGSDYKDNYVLKAQPQ